MLCWDWSGLSPEYLWGSFLKQRLQPKRNYKMSKIEGYIFPALNIGLCAPFSCAGFIFFSEKGPALCPRLY